MNLNQAKKIVNHARKVTGRNWPTPVEYIGGGANGKVYLTNSGKIMKIATGSQPQEFRPLHILRNTGFVPKFNQRNWAIIPMTKRTFDKRTNVLTGNVLFKKTKQTKNEMKRIIENIQKIKRDKMKIENEMRKENNGNILNILRQQKNTYNSQLRLLEYKQKMNKTTKKATLFLMNKIGDTVMTLTDFMKNKPQGLIREIVRDMIKMMHNRGISHGNLHTGNILVSISSTGGVKFWVIDFGRSVVIPSGMTENNVYKKFRIGKYTRGIPVYYAPKTGRTHIKNLNNWKI